MRCQLPGKWRVGPGLTLCLQALTSAEPDCGALLLSMGRNNEWKRPPRRSGSEEVSSDQVCGAAGTGMRRCGRHPWSPRLHPAAQLVGKEREVGQTPSFFPSSRPTLWVLSSNTGWARVVGPLPLGRREAGTRSLLKMLNGECLGFALFSFFLIC